MKYSSKEFKAYADLEKQRNQRDFFDKFIRLPQKARVKDSYPDVNHLIKLDCYSMLLDKTFGKPKPIKDDKGNLKDFEIKVSDNIQIIKDTIDLIKSEKLEYSISIDGAGRKEYVQTNIEPKQDKEEEKEKDLFDKLADKLG